MKLRLQLIAAVVPIFLWATASPAQLVLPGPPAEIPATNTQRLLGLPAEQQRAIDEAAVKQDWPRAEALLWDAATDNPESSALWAALGEAHFRNERYFAAAKAFARSMRLGDPSAGSRLALATSYIALDRRHWARPILEDLIRDYPGSAVYRYWLAGIYAHEQWYETALRELDLAIATDPGFAPAYDRRGVCLEALGDEEEASSAYRKSIEFEKQQRQETAWPRLHLAGLLHQQGDLESAEQLLREAVKLDSAPAPAFYELGVILRKLDKLGDAERMLHQAIQLDPADPKPHYALADVFRRKGEKEKAAAELKTFRDLTRER